MPTQVPDTVVSVGRKVKKLREDKNISLDSVANETGCSTNELEQIESGKKIPPVGLLLQISRALEIDSNFFFKKRESATAGDMKGNLTHADNYEYLPLTPDVGNKYLKAFKVFIAAEQNTVGEGYLHEGEEFIYVVKGKIEVTVGDHVNILNQGGHLHFNSGINHKLRNIGKQKAELIVVIYGK